MSITSALVLYAVIWFMVLFVVLPLIALLLRAGLGVLLQNLANTQVMQAVGLTLMTTTVTTLLAVLMGTPLAYLLARYEFRGRNIAGRGRGGAADGLWATRGAWQLPE